MLTFRLTSHVGADTLVRPDSEGNRNPKFTSLGSGFTVRPALRFFQPSPDSGHATYSAKSDVDTDIGDDIDDAFALGLALRSPELQVLGVTTTFGNTELRAKLASRLLQEAGRADIPVAAGTPTHNNNTFSQRPYAERGHFRRTQLPPSIFYWSRFGAIRARSR